MTSFSGTGWISSIWICGAGLVGFTSPTIRKALRKEEGSINKTIHALSGVPHAPPAGSAPGGKLMKGGLGEK